MAGHGLHHVGVKAHDWDASLRFYREALGFTVRLGWGEAPSRIALLGTDDGVRVEVFEDVEYVPQATGSLDTGTALLHLCLELDDLDEAYARAVALGARTVLEPQDVELELTVGDGPLAVRVCFFEGPSGELIELLRNNG
jgi:glyoxylase I family protein